jgi:excisionase family DNA binding protein
MATVPPKRLTYSVAEAAGLLGVSRAGLYLHIRAGRVRTFKWGGRTLIRADDLQAAIDLASGRAPEGQHDGSGRQAES